MFKRFIVMTTVVLVLLFLMASLYAYFGLESPACYAGIPGMFALGYIIGDWCRSRFK